MLVGPVTGGVSAEAPFYVGGRENDNFYNILAHAHPDSSRISS